MPTSIELRAQAERLRARADHELEQAAAIEERAHQLELLGTPPESGSILRWDARFHGHGTVYSYAALNVGGRWYTTGPVEANTNPRGRSWSNLIDWISTSLHSDLVVIRPTAPTARLEGEARSVDVLLQGVLLQGAL